MPESDTSVTGADLAVLGRGLAGAGHGFLEDRGGEEPAKGQCRGEHHELEREAEHATPPSGRTGGCEG